MKKIKVLHIVTEMNRGGLETMIMNYYRIVNRNEFQFDFLVHRNEKKDFDDEILSLGGVIHRLPYLNPLSIKYLKKTNQFFKNNKSYDIIHSHLDTLSTIPLYFAKKHGHKIRIAHSHSTRFDFNIKSLVKYLSKILVKNVASEKYSCSHKAGKWLFGKGKYKVINNAIDPNAFNFDIHLRNKYQKDFNVDDEIVVGHIGSFVPAKNHVRIINIFNELTKHKKAKLILIGDGKLKKDIIALVEKLNLSNQVLFLNKINNVNEVINIFDVLLFPSIYEGLPLTLVEAQANGLNCVVSDVVTDEIKLSNKIKFISLHQSNEKWCDEIVSSFDDKDRYNVVTESNYNIKNEVLKLENIYRSLIYSTITTRF
jgi:glycosyltransferase involved in cell wall biosynthesis